jgi:protease PrsW
MKAIFSLLPVLLFLASLFLFDSFKLVSRKSLLLCLLWGVIAAWLAYHMNGWLVGQLALDSSIFSRYLAPLTEELLKSVLLLVLVFRQRIGFSIDAAIYGFAAGTGFALAENIAYLNFLSPDATLVVWMIRGFGTAIMHGGATALFAMLLIGGIQREKPFLLSLIPALVLAYLVHSGFNHFFLNPYLQVALIVTVLPALFYIIFQQSTHVLQQWLEIEFSNEVEMLSMIRRGEFSGTKAGNYLVELKKHFSPEMILDLYCYLSLYLELSVKAKRNLMLKENGFPIIRENDIADKLTELRLLRKAIGKIGELALQPLVRMKHRELWKLNQL